MIQKTPTEQTLADEIVRYIRCRFLDGELDDDFDDTTPLLEYGILNSIRTATLLTFIRDELGTDISRLELTPVTLNTVRDLVRALTARDGGSGRG